MFAAQPAAVEAAAQSSKHPPVFVGSRFDLFFVREQLEGGVWKGKWQPTLCCTPGFFCRPCHRTKVSLILQTGLLTSMLPGFVGPNSLGVPQKRPPIFGKPKGTGSWGCPDQILPVVVCSIIRVSHPKWCEADFVHSHSTHTLVCQRPYACLKD